MFGSKPPHSSKGHHQNTNSNNNANGSVPNTPNSSQLSQLQLQQQKLRRRLSTDSVNSVSSTGGGGGSGRAGTPGLSNYTNMNDERPNSTASNYSTHNHHHHHQVSSSATSVANTNGSKESNIQVVLRCRSRNEREQKENSPIVVNIGTKEKEVQVPAGSSTTERRTYNFDKVFGIETNQLMLYQQVAQPILEEVLCGYNCTIFAYGQTGTGKTYTMEGDLQDRLGTCSSDAGVIPRILYQLFDRLNSSSTTTAASGGEEYSVRISYLELYNEEVRDLLTPISPETTNSNSNNNNNNNNNNNGLLKIYDDRDNPPGVIVQGLEEVVAHTAQQGIEALRRGSAKRTTAATRCNDKSSRSHAVFTITVHVQETLEDGTGEGLLKVGKLNLVDLAGSENINRSGAAEKQAKEAGSINKSLLTLGRVINSLTSHALHIPYRESKLTRLLQDSLGGKTKTCIIATIGPTKASLDETISTLEYASRAKSIRNRPEMNQKMTKKELIRIYVLEIERLQKELHATREKNGVYLTPEAFEALQTENRGTKDHLSELKQQLNGTIAELALTESRFQENLRLLKTSEHALELTQSELEAKQVALDELEKELTRTEQMLKEESMLKEAFARSERQLNKIASQLSQTVQETSRDVEGLHDKLDRKQEIEQQNQVALKEFRSTLLKASKGLQGGIRDFGTKQDDLVEGIRRSMGSFRDRMANETEETKVLLASKLELLKVTANQSRSLIDGSHTRAVEFERQYDVAGQEAQRVVEEKLRSVQETAVKELEQVHDAMKSYSTWVITRQEEVTKRMIELIETSKQFSDQSSNFLKAALDTLSQATVKEKKDLQDHKDLLLKQMEQKAKEDQVRQQELMVGMQNLLQGFLSQDADRSKQIVQTAHSKLNHSIENLESLHVSQIAAAKEYDRLTNDRNRELETIKTESHQETVVTMTTVEKFKVEFGEMETDSKENLCQHFENTREQIMEAAVESIRTRVVAPALVQEATFRDNILSQVEKNLEEVSRTFETVQERQQGMETKSQASVGHWDHQLVEVKQLAHELGTSSVQQLGESDGEVRRLVDETIETDKDPAATRKEYCYPKTWGLARPEVELLKEFRELGKVEEYLTSPDAASIALASRSMDPNGMDLDVHGSNTGAQDISGLEEEGEKEKDEEEDNYSKSGGMVGSFYENGSHDSQDEIMSRFPGSALSSGAPSSSSSSVFSDASLVNFSNNSHPAKQLPQSSQQTQQHQQQTQTQTLTTTRQLSSDVAPPLPYSLPSSSSPSKSRRNSGVELSQELQVQNVPLNAIDINRQHHAVDEVSHGMTVAAATSGLFSSNFSSKTGSSLGFGINGKSTKSAAATTSRPTSSGILQRPIRAHKSIFSQNTPPVTFQSSSSSATTTSSSSSISAPSTASSLTGPGSAAPSSLFSMGAHKQLLNRAPPLSTAAAISAVSKPPQLPTGPTTSATTISTPLSATAQASSISSASLSLCQLNPNTQPQQQPQQEQQQQQQVPAGSVGQTPAATTTTSSTATTLLSNKRPLPMTSTSDQQRHTSTSNALMAGNHLAMKDRERPRKMARIPPRP